MSDTPSTIVIVRVPQGVHKVAYGALEMQPHQANGVSILELPGYVAVACGYPLLDGQRTLGTFDEELANARGFELDYMLGAHGQRDRMPDGAAVPDRAGRAASIYKARGAPAFKDVTS